MVSIIAILMAHSHITFAPAKINSKKTKADTAKRQKTKADTAKRHDTAKRQRLTPRSATPRSATPRGARHREAPKADTAKRQKTKADTAKRHVLRGASASAEEALLHAVLEPISSIRRTD
jgi:hypothetical protein